MSNDMKGTLGEVLDKVYEIYMNTNVTDKSVIRYLYLTGAFSMEEVTKLMDMLRRDKRENGYF